MKRYLLFAGARDWPRGGWGDFQGSYDDPNDAEYDAKGLDDYGSWEYDWYEVVDVATGRVVAGRDSDQL